MKQELVESAPAQEAASAVCVFAARFRWRIAAADHCRQNSAAVQGVYMFSICLFSISIFLGMESLDAGTNTQSSPPSKSVLLILSNTS